MTKTKLTTRSLVGILTGNTLMPKIMLANSKSFVEINHVPESLQVELRHAFNLKRPWARVSYSTIEGFNILREIEVVDITKHTKND